MTRTGPQPTPYSKLQLDYTRKFEKVKELLIRIHSDETGRLEDSEELHDIIEDLVKVGCKALWQQSLRGK